MRRILTGLFVCILLFASGPIVPIYGATLGDIIASTRYKLNDSTVSVNSPTWSDPELTKRANAVQNFIAYTTRCLYVNDLSTPIAGVREYLRPANCIAIDRVSVISAPTSTAGNQYRKVPFATMGGMDRDLIGWEQYPPGLPLHYYLRGDYIGFDRPFDALHCSTGAIKIDYFKYPADMVANQDQPFDGAAYLQLYSDAIVLGVAYKCKQDEQRWSEASTLQAEFISVVNTMIDSLNANNDNTVQHIKIGN